MTGLFANAFDEARLGAAPGSYADAQQVYDAIVIGSGVSGAFMANGLVKAGWNTLVVEAGKFFYRDTFPDKEGEANAELYWGGGVELDTHARLALLRPKAVGGGSVVNQALLDRFDGLAWESWQQKSGIKVFDCESMASWYDQVGEHINLETIDPEAANGNAQIFRRGFEANGYTWASMQRGQKNCRNSEGNDCIKCLSGCRLDSKQSMIATTLRQSLGNGLGMRSRFEVRYIHEGPQVHKIVGVDSYGTWHTLFARHVVLASGAIGNSKILLASGFGRRLPALGRGFYTHPQYMSLGIYEQEVCSHKGALQAYKSADTGFRKAGFKLESVYAPPVALSMLFKGYGTDHHQRMRLLRNMACVEVAVRDTYPGVLQWSRAKGLSIHKTLNEEDNRRRVAGTEAIEKIFKATGASEIVHGAMGIGLHLMGGCAIGHDRRTSVVGPDFQVHGHPRVYIADSSVFPDAPGINPSYTIMALSTMAATTITADHSPSH